ncbi:alpha/beta fold hydrolase [Nocardioides panaciterrulae]|uniref:Pimeloyl-ACP methyl ester carboxylesterase n=1 Tax=Nocardioides panaciterrulae TaxID=661492 RepID=A0A7Y9E941_9ACTN|nr:pimeloyl-ACP methyl ester carboxylesterase [Nocardioides panaciterrulae]
MPVESHPPVAPRLLPTHLPRRPQGAVLVLHGGASRPGRPPVSPAQLSVLRMVPVARRVARAARGRLAVFRLLNSYRGWDTTHTPLDDVAWALGEVRQRYGELPVGLVGHSLGGRAALLAGARDGVRSVVALNPWVYPSDHADLAGRRVLFVHGTEDRVADPARAAAVARRLAATTDVGFVSVPGGRHAMLRHGGLFERAAADFCLATLLEPPPGRPAGVVGRVLDGEQWVSAG